MLTETEKSQRFDLMLDYIKRLEATYGSSASRLREEACLIAAEADKLAAPSPERSKLLRTVAGCNAKAKVYEKTMRDLRFVIRKNEYER